MKVVITSHDIKILFTYAWVSVMQVFIMFLFQLWVWIHMIDCFISFSCDLIQISYKLYWVGLIYDNWRLNCRSLGSIITCHSSIIWYLIYIESEVNWTAIFVYVSHIWNFVIELAVVYQCPNDLSVLIEVSWAVSLS